MPDAGPTAGPAAEDSGLSQAAEDSGPSHAAEDSGPSHNEAIELERLRAEVNELRAQQAARRRARSDLGAGRLDR